MQPFSGTEACCFSFSSKTIAVISLAVSWSNAANSTALRRGEVSVQDADGKNTYGTGLAIAFNKRKASSDSRGSSGGQSMKKRC
jgi:glycerol kinase